MSILNRFVWVYLAWDVKKQEGELSLWTSPDQDAPRLDTIATPFIYHAIRNDVRYNVNSEIELAEKTVIKICGAMYDTEFVISKTIARKRSRR